MDLTQRNGNYQVLPQAGSILGVEFSGAISSFGDSDLEREEFKIGDEVFGLAYGGNILSSLVFLVANSVMLGAYAEYVAVATKMLIHKPRSMTWETATAVPETWITATQAMSLISGSRPVNRFSGTQVPHLFP